MTDILKGAGDKANPTGELRARKLINWYNRGAGGRIRWGVPGDFDACVRIAGRHMTPSQAKGFCAERHRDATGANPGQAPAERAARRTRKSVDDIPVAIMTTDADGRSVVAKLAPLRLSVVEGPGLLVTHGSTQVQIDGSEPDEGVAKMSTASVSGDGGNFDADGLSIDPRTVGDGWGYEVKAEGRRVAWLPTAAEVPGWAEGADLVFTKAGVAAPGGFKGKLVPAEDEGTTYVLRQGGLARSPARKSLVDKLRGLLTTRNSGQPQLGDIFDGEAIKNGARLNWTVGKALAGQRTYDETRALIDRALRRAYAEDEKVWVYVRDLSDDLVVFEVNGGGDAGLYQARYVIDDDAGEVAFDDPEPVEERREYVPKLRRDWWSGPTMKAVEGPVIKSDESHRYTLAPLYPASPETPSTDHLDAHGDFATAEDLQKAVWDYVRAKDFTIRDQHRDATAVGEAVEIVSWPYEVTVPLTKSDGTVVEKAFAPGTVFLGVVWNEKGWEDIRKGRKTGYSLGGVATRVAVEMA